MNDDDEKEDSVRRAIDSELFEGVQRLCATFVKELEVSNSSAEELASKFRRGLAVHCLAHDKLTVIARDYFKGPKS
jgi:hypothetical protein